MSPGSGMSEEDRRALIASQRAQLYGEGAALSENGSFPSENAPRPGTQGSGPRDHSPFQNGQADGEQIQQPAGQRSPTNSNSSPASNPTGFGLFEAAQQSSRTSASSPAGSPPRGAKAAGTSGVAPIGTRPNVSGPNQAVNPALNKGRSTTPLPSPLSYGFAANEENNKGDRATSVASNPTSNGQDVGLGGWGNKSGVWGKNSLGVQASVWG